MEETRQVTGGPRLADLKTSQEIIKRVYEQAKPKTREQQRLHCNLQNGIVYLDDGIEAVQEVLLLMKDALADLTALYAATPGHDPSFVEKGQHAMEKLRGL